MYKGGKNGNGTYQTIINQIPPHDIYSELFAGSAAIHFNILPAPINIICDKSREQYEILKNKVSPGTIVLNCDTAANITIFVNLFNILHSLSHSVFCYLDPPYPFESRSWKKPIYKHEMSDKDHIALLSGIGQAKFPVAISSYKNSIYSGKLKNWRLLKYQSIVRGGTRTEYLYMNYPAPSQLHDYRYLGNDFRERESISRKKNNMVRKLKSLQPSLLNAILKQLNSST